MAVMAKDNGNADFEREPAGTHLAICYLVADLGLQESSFDGKSKIQHKVVLGWELPNEHMQDGRPFGCSKIYTLSLNERANLCKDLESWRGVPFTEADKDGFDLQRILGKPCQVTIIHEKKGDKTYSNVTTVTSVVKGMQVPQRTNDLVYYDHSEPNDIALQKLPEWIRKKIANAVPPLPTVAQELGGFDERNPPPAGMDDDVPFNRAPAHA